jgi:hypothetical protein
MNDMRRLPSGAGREARGALSSIFVIPVPPPFAGRGMFRPRRYIAYFSGCHGVKRQIGEAEAPLSGWGNAMRYIAIVHKDENGARGATRSGLIQAATRAKNFFIRRPA